MFNSQKRPYTIYKPNKTTDEYNQEKIEWVESGTELCFIALNTHGPANSPLFAQQCEWIGTTTSTSIVEQGDRVGDYEVVFVVVAGRDKFLYLKQYGR